MTTPGLPVLLTPAEVAAIFHVHPRTVTRWGAEGRITTIRTPGGHLRYRTEDIRQLLNGDTHNQGDTQP